MKKPAGFGPKLTISAVLLFAVAAAALYAGHSTKNIPLVPNFDINKYTGLWYEIARMPHRFERDLIAVTATYTLEKHGKITVQNEGYVGNLTGKKKSIKGRAWIPDPKTPALLKVSFFLFFASDYRVIALDENYKWAMVAGGNTNYLWILCRRPEMSPALYDSLVHKAAGWGFDTSLLIKVPHPAPIAT